VVSPPDLVQTPAYTTHPHSIRGSDPSERLQEDYKLRDNNHLRSLATQLPYPPGRCIALMRAIEERTTQSLSDRDLVDAAERALKR
jgi:hypothetical protein